MCCKIAWRRYRDPTQSGVDRDYHHQVARHPLAQPDAGVEAIAHHIDEFVLDDDFERHLGVGAGQLPEGWGEPTYPLSKEH